MKKLAFFIIILLLPTPLLAQQASQAKKDVDGYSLAPLSPHKSDRDRNLALKAASLPLAPLEEKRNLLFRIVGLTPTPLPSSPSPSLKVRTIWRDIARLYAILGHEKNLKSQYSIAYFIHPKDKKIYSQLSQKPSEIKSQLGRRLEELRRVLGIPSSWLTILDLINKNKSTEIPLNINLPQKFKVPSNDYSELLRGLKRGKMKFTLKLKRGKYSLVMGGKKLTVLVPYSGFLVRGKVDFDLKSTEKKGSNVFFTPQILKFQFDMEGPLLLDAGMFKALVWKIESHHMKQLGLKIQFLNLLSRYVSQAVLKLENRTPKGKMASLIQNVNVQRAEMFFKKGFVWSKGNSRLVIGKQGRLLLTRFSYNNQNHSTQGQFQLNLDLAKGSQLDVKNLKVRTKRGRLALQGSFTRTKKRLFYKINPQPSPSWILFNGLKIDFPGKKGASLSWRQLKIRFLQFHYNHWSQGHETFIIKTESNLNYGRGVFPLNGGGLKAGKINIPHINLNYQKRNAKKTLSGHLKKGITLGDVLWRLSNQKEQFQIVKGQLETGAIRFQGWKKLKLNLKKFSFARQSKISYKTRGGETLSVLLNPSTQLGFKGPFTINPSQPKHSSLPSRLVLKGKIPKMLYRTGNQTYRFTKIKTKQLVFSIGKNFSAGGDLQFTSKTNGLAGNLTNQVKNATVTLNNFQLQKQNDHLVVAFPSLKIALPKRHIKKLIKSQIPTQITLPNQNISAGDQKTLKTASLGQIRNAGFHDMKLKNIHLTRFRLGKNKIHFQLNLDFESQIKIEQKHHKIIKKLPPKVKTWWSWENIAPLKTSLQLRGILDISLVGKPALVEKKINLNLKQNAVRILHFLPAVQNRIRKLPKPVQKPLLSLFKAISRTVRQKMASAIQQKLNQLPPHEVKIFKNPSPAQRKRLERIKIQKFRFHTNNRQVYFILQGRIK